MNRPNYLRAGKFSAGSKDESEIEATFALQLRAGLFPKWERNYRHLADRKFEIDFAWPVFNFGIEIDGEAHRIKERFHSDIEKHALSLLAGWTILRIGGREVRSGIGIGWATDMLRKRGVNV
jgi:very-short-patch-repair endonuclease